MPTKTCLNCTRADCRTRNTQNPFQHCQRWTDVVSAAQPLPLSRPLPPNAPILVTGTWDGARRWLAHAGLCERLKLFCQVMLGFELQSLHKSMDMHQGKRSDLPQNANFRQVGGSWETVLQKEAGLTETSARRFMEMARAATPRLKKLPALKDFDPSAKPIAQLPAPQQEALSKAVKKLTDGLTQREFGEQLGLWKKPQGGPGRAPGSGGRPPGPVTPDEILAAKQKIAREDVDQAIKALTTLAGKWIVLPDADQTTLTALRAHCEQQARALAAWLDAPPARRDPAQVEKLLSSSSSFSSSSSPASDNRAKAKALLRAVESCQAAMTQPGTAKA